MISIKNEQEISLMRKAGNIVYRTHQHLKKYLKPGITTKELDKIAYDFIISCGATPSFKNYNGFPASICTSINEEVVHGIPGNRKLKNGDLISIDIGACYKGYHGDSAWSYPIGDVVEEKKYLLEHTEKALYEGLRMVKAGNRLGDIGYAIEKYAHKHRLGVVRELVGHGVGTHLHEDPQIPNFRQKKKGIKLCAGMTLAIEPMINIGRSDVEWLDDDWTVVTEDGTYSAHYENTIAITPDGEPEILTLL